MADNKISNVANLIERTRTNAKETPAPQYARTADLINRTIGARNLSSRSGSWKGIINNPYVGEYREVETPAEPEQWQKTLSEIVAPTNAIGWTLRAITSFGRGITNSVAAGLERGVEFTKAMDKGDTGKAINEAAMTLPDMAWSTFKGFADSFLPEFDSWIKDIDSRPIYEGAYDLMKSDTYKQFAEIDKKQTGDTFMQDIASEKPIGRLGWENFGLDITPIGLTATGWDIFMDPASYMTFGIGGALKGANKGLSAVKAYKKAGSPKEIADIPTRAMPSAIYKGEKGAAVFEAPTYNVANTSPAFYILKEMGRGFGEAHRRAWVKSAKAANRRSYLQGFLEQINGTLSAVKTQDEFEEIIADPSFASRQADLFDQKYGARARLSEDELKAIRKESINDLLADIEARGEVLREIYDPSRRSRLQAIADERGIPLVAQSAEALAAAYSRSIPGRTRVFVRPKQIDYDAESLINYKNSIDAALDPRNPDPNFNLAESLNTLKASVDEKTWETIVFHLAKDAFTVPRKGRKKNNVGIAEDLAAAGGRLREGSTDEYTVTPEQITNTKLSRTKTELASSAEERWLSGQGSGLRKKRQGGKSALTSGSRESNPNVWTNAQVREFGMKIRAALEGKPVDPSKITGEDLAATDLPAALYAARIGYLGQPTTAYSESVQTLIDAAARSYNPFTVELQPRRIGSFAVTLEGRRAAKDAEESTTYLSAVVKAAKEFKAFIDDPVITNVLKKSGLKDADIEALRLKYADNETALLSQMHEVLHGARLAQAENLRRIELEDLARRIDNINSRYNLKELAPNETDLMFGLGRAAAQRAITEKMSKLTEIKDLTRNYQDALPTNEEIEAAAARLSEIYEARLSAIEELTRMGFSPFSRQGKIIVDVLANTNVPIVRKTKSEKTMEGLKQAVKVTLPKEPGNLDKMFGVLSQRLVAFAKANQPLPANTQKAYDQIGKLLNGLAKDGKEVIYTPKQGREILARIGNFIKGGEEIEVFGSSSYNIAFRNKGGEINRDRVASFLMQAYRSSMSQAGDGGTFAKYIDGLLAKNNLPSVAETPRGQQVSLFGKLKDKWRGEELGIEILAAMARDTRNKGLKKGALPEVKADARAFTQGLFDDAARMEADIRQEAAERIMATDRGLAADIRANEEQFMFAGKTGNTGNMLVAITKNFEEQKLVQDALDSSLIETSKVQEYIQELNRLLPAGKQIQPKQFIDWKKFKPRNLLKASVTPENPEIGATKASIGLFDELLSPLWGQKFLKQSDVDELNKLRVKFLKDMNMTKESFERQFGLEVTTAVWSPFTSKTVGRARKQIVTAKQSLENKLDLLIKAKNKPTREAEIERLQTAVYFAGLRDAYQQAIRAVEYSRAAAIVDQMYPPYATAKEIIKNINKILETDPTKLIQADALMRSHIMLADTIVNADTALRLDYQSHSAMSTGQISSSVVKRKRAEAERTKLDKVLMAAEKKFQAAGFNRGTTSTENMSLEDVLATKNPMLLTDFIRNFKIEPGNQESLGTWRAALATLEKYTIVKEGKSAYKNVAELITSYVNNRTRLAPGEINPMTGRPVPTNEQILNLIALKDESGAFVWGNNVGRKAEDALISGITPDSANIKRWLRDSLPKADVATGLQIARSNDFIRASYMVAPDDVRAVADELEAPEIVSAQAGETLNRMLEELASSGRSDIIDFAALFVGQSQRKFMIEGAELAEVEIDKLGNTFKTDGPKGSRRAQKFTYEAQNVYTGWKALIQNLSDAAARLEYGPNSIERQLFMTENALMVLRLVDAYNTSRGIFPASTLGLKEGEATALGITEIFDAATSSTVKQNANAAIFLNIGDIMDALGKDVVGEVFFSGKTTSLPPTSLVAPARLMVMAMNKLAPGAWFNENEMQQLVDTMYTLMQNHIKSVTSLEAGKKVTVFDVKPQEAYDNIRQIVSLLTSPQVAERIYQTHVINGGYAKTILQYKAGKVNENIVAAWQRALNSPISTTGFKMEATVEAFEELYRLIDLEPDPNMKLAIEMDAKVQMLAQLKPNDLNILASAERMADTWETEGIKGVIGTQQRNANRADVARANAVLTDVNLGNKLAAAAREGLDDSYVLDVFNENAVAQQEINWRLKFATKITESMFAETGMEDLRYLYAQSEIPIQREIDSYAEGIETFVTQIRQQFPNRAIEVEAFNLLREMPEEALNRYADSYDMYVKMLDKRFDPNLDADTMARLVDDLENFNQLVPTDDEALKKVAIQLWKAIGGLLGGGRYSLVLRSGLDPQIINRQIRELGAGRLVTAIDVDGNYTVKKDGFGFPQGAKTIGEVANAWRDWDLSNPLEAVLVLNQALRQASKVPEMAVTVDRMFGVPKSNYKNAKEAAKDGLVAIKTVTSVQPGKELVHYMQTEGLYYPVEMAMQLRKFSEFLTEVKRMQPNGKMEQALLAVAPIQNFMKQQSTLYTPKNWVQSTIGGYFTNFMAGVNNPVSASMRSYKMLATQGISSDALGIAPDALDAMWAKTVANSRKQNLVIKAANDPTGDTLGITVKGTTRNISYKDLGQLFNQLGGIPPHTQARDLDDLRPSKVDGSNIKNKNKLKQMYSGYQHVTARLGKAAAARDAWLRGQLFLDVLAKGNWNSLEAGAREAMRVANRYHPQMQDLSTFNQVYTRQLVLFYTWRAKTLGWILTDLLDKPGRILAPLKAQYNLTQNEDIEYKQFGDFDPLGYNLPSYAQNNMDPLAMNSEGGLVGFSVANPVTDLLGSTGWLSGINWNNFESSNPLENLGVNAMSNIGGTFQRFALTAEPIVISTIMDYARGETFNGTRIGNGQGDFSVLTDPPALVEDFANRLGLGYTLTIAAGLFPDQFIKASQEGESREFIQSEAGRAFFNWLTGLKYVQKDTLKMRDKGWQEALTRIENAVKTGTFKIED